MAIYHLDAKVFGRSKGACAVAKAAYRAGEKLHDERQGRTFDYTRKAVEHREILVPTGAPEWATDRLRLWNAVEAAEKRVDAQVAREVEVALPVELTSEQMLDLVRQFAREQFVERGMIADIALHNRDGSNPHAHMLLTTRLISGSGFGPKNREWNEKSVLLGWREEWANCCNRALERAGVSVRIDHRSYAEQGIRLEPTEHLGIPVRAAFDAKHPRRMANTRAVVDELSSRHRHTVAKNTKSILKDPKIALHAIATTRSTFSEADLTSYLFCKVDSDKLEEVTKRCLAHESVIRLGRDDDGRERFCLLSTLQREREVVRFAERLASRSRHCVSSGNVRAASMMRTLSLEQEMAYRYLVQESPDVAVVQGYAGAGKSYLLGTARQAWEAQGLRVIGAALAGKAAEGLEKDSGIESRTIASRLLAWREGRERLTSRDVLVIDEAGMVGTSDMHRILSRAEAAGAKVVLVGDTMQLQAVEAGAAMRAIAERIGEVTISNVLRQREAWMREASRAMGKGRTLESLAAYREHGCLFSHLTKEDALQEVVNSWERTRKEHPDGSQLLLAYERADVAALNAKVRERLKQSGLLTNGVSVSTTSGTKEFAPGDRLVFLKNDRQLAVKNGSVGCVRRISRGLTGANLVVDLLSEKGEIERTVEFNSRGYGSFDHGYALTVHKSQGATVDHVHVLAGRMFDLHTTYVALSRHRTSVSLHWAEEEFGDEKSLMLRLARTANRVSALDYALAYDLDTEVEPRRGFFKPKTTLKERIETRNRLLRERLEKLSDSELLETRETMSRIAACKVEPPGDLSNDYPAISTLQAEVNEAHSRLEPLAKRWSGIRHEQEQRHRLVMFARALVGTSGEERSVYTAFVEAFEAREKAITKLQELQREISLRDETRKLAHGEQVEIRRARAEVRAIDVILKDRRRLQLNAALDSLEQQHANAFRAWADFKSIHSADGGVALAYKGEGPGTKVLEDIRSVEKAISENRYELAGIVGRRKDFFGPIEVALPQTEADIAAATDEAIRKFELAAYRWADYAKLAINTAEGREEKDGKTFGAQLYLEYVRSDRERRHLSKKLAEIRKLRRISELSIKLTAAESRYVELDRELREFLAKSPEAAREIWGDGPAAKIFEAQREAERQVGKLQWSLDRQLEKDAQENEIEQPEKPPAQRLTEAEGRLKEAASQWEEFKKSGATPEAILEARKGKGPAAALAAEYTAAYAEHRSARIEFAKFEKARRLSELSAQLSDAETRYAQCSRELSELVAKNSGAAKEVWGEGPAAKLFAGQRDAEREIGKLQWILERQLTSSKKAAEGKPEKESEKATEQEPEKKVEQPEKQPPQRLAEAEIRLRKATDQWEQCKSTAMPEAILEARKGEGPAAALAAEYTAAYAEHRSARIEFAKFEKARRIAELSVKLTEAETRYAQCSRELSELVAKNPEAAKELWGETPTAKLFAGQRDAEREIGKLQWILERQLASEKAAQKKLEKNSKKAEEQEPERDPEKTVGGSDKGTPQSEKLPAQRLAEAERRLKEAVGPWEEFKKTATPEAILEARRGQGPAAALAAEYTSALIEHGNARIEVAKFEKARRLSELSAQLNDAETRYAQCSRELSELVAKNPGAAKELWGETPAAKLFAGQRDAEREIGKLQWTLERQLATPSKKHSETVKALGEAAEKVPEKETPPEQNASQPEKPPAQRLTEAEGRLREAVSKWEGHKKSATAEAILEARKGEGPAAALVAEYTAAYAEHRTARIEVVKHEKSRRTVELATELAKAETREDQAGGAWRLVLRHNPEQVEPALDGQGGAAAVLNAYRRAERDRSRLETALHRELGVKPAPPTPRADVQALRVSERLALLENRMTTARRAWREFREQHPELVLQARSESGAGAPILREYREARASVQEVSKQLEHELVLQQARGPIIER